MNSLYPLDGVKEVVQGAKMIPYHKEYNVFTGCVINTLMFQQIIYKWNCFHKKEFFFFLEPNDHKEYTGENSWVDELGLSKFQVSSAIQSLGLKRGSKLKLLVEDTYKHQLKIEKLSNQDNEKIKIVYEKYLESKFFQYYYTFEKLTYFKINPLIVDIFVSLVKGKQQYSVDFYYKLINLISIEKLINLVSIEKSIDLISIYKLEIEKELNKIKDIYVEDESPTTLSTQNKTSIKEETLKTLLDFYSEKQISSIQEKNYSLSTEEIFQCILDVLEEEVNEESKLGVPEYKTKITIKIQNKHTLNITTEWVTWCNELFNKKWRVIDSLKKEVGARLKEGYKIEDLKDAMNHAMNSFPHNENNYKYLSPSFIVNKRKLETWLNIEVSDISHKKEKTFINLVNENFGKDYLKKIMTHIGNIYSLKSTDIDLDTIPSLITTINNRLSLLVQSIIAEENRINFRNYNLRKIKELIPDIVIPERRHKEAALVKLMENISKTAESSHDTSRYGKQINSVWISQITKVY